MPLNKEAKPNQTKSNQYIDRLETYYETAQYSHLLSSVKILEIIVNLKSSVNLPNEKQNSVLWKPIKKHLQ